MDLVLGGNGNGADGAAGAAGGGAAAARAPPPPRINTQPPEAGGVSSYIVVTHQHSTIRRAVDRLIFLHEGRVVSLVGSGRPCGRSARALKARGSKGGDGSNAGLGRGSAYRTRLLSGSRAQGWGGHRSGSLGWRTGPGRGSCCWRGGRVQGPPGAGLMA